MRGRQRPYGQQQQHSAHYVADSGPMPGEPDYSDSDTYNSSYVPDGCDDFMSSVFNVNSKSSTNAPAIMVPVTINSVPVQMELDTGASPSLMSYHDYMKYLPHVPLEETDRTFHAYGEGIPLKSAGKLMADVQYKSQRAVLPLFVVHAQPGAPSLLGREWMRQIRLDWTQIFSEGVYQVKSPLDDLKQHYADLFQDGLGTVTGVEATLHLVDDARPKFLRARPVPYAMRPAVEQEIARLEQEGVIEPVQFSNWATPLVCVPKVDGSVRICGDYRSTVNTCLKVEQYPIPSAEEIRQNLAGGQKYSKIDLRCAYQQMKLDEKSQEICTINTLKGLYRYTRLPFGIASSPAIWQRFMEQALGGLTGICVMQDDVLVTGASDDEHLKNLEKVFERFRKYGLRLKAEKCSFMQPMVVYYGLCISKDGVKPTKEKVEAIKQAPVPKNQTELRSFLGMVAALSTFIANLPTLTHPLNHLLGKRPWIWSEQCDVAFEQLKQAITSDVVLAHYDPKLPVEMASDASNYGVGGVLMHVYPDGSRRPIAFASRTLNEHEKLYGQIDKEALGIIFCLKKFRLYLYGRHFTILTDHKPLERIFGNKTAIPALAAQRLQRWAIILSAFSYDIKYVTSQQNAVADALSRLPLPHSSRDEEVFRIEESLLDSLPVTHKEIMDATRRDPVLSRVLEYTQNGWPNVITDQRLKPFQQRKDELSVEMNCIMWGMRVIIPEHYRLRMLEELHSEHVGIVRMKELARSYFWWPNLDKEIESTVRNCKPCADVRHAPARAPLMPWRWPSKPWERLHIDFAEKQGQHFLIIVDAHSRWPEIVHMHKTTTTTATITALRNLFAKYGLPLQICSDNGPQFTSAEFEHFCKQNGVKHIRVAPYHAASNGMAERMVQSFKQCLTASQSSHCTTQQIIDRFLLTYRSCKHPTTACTPASLFLGRELRTRLSLVRPSVGLQVANSQSSQKQYHDIHVKYREFYPGDAVLVQDIRKEDTWWLGTIAERTAPKSYTVVLRDGRVWKRHVDHLRRSTMSNDMTSMDEPDDRVPVPAVTFEEVNPPLVVPQAQPACEQTVPHLYRPYHRWINQPVHLQQRIMCL